MIRVFLVFTLSLFSIKQNADRLWPGFDVNKNQNLKKEQASDLNQKLGFLQGVWAEGGAENALFLIKGDSLYYFDHLDNPLHFQIQNDSVLIYNSELPLVNKIIKLNSDTLFINTADADTLFLYKRSE